MNTHKALASAAAVLMLAGCSGVSVYGDNAPQIDYFDGDFDYATNMGAIVTEVYGNPFNLPAEQFRDIVLKDMDRRNRGVPAHFSAKPTDRTLPPYKVVVVFDPVPRASATDLCENGAKQVGTGPDGTVRAAMAFCFGGQPKTEVSGKATNVTGALDPKFRSLVRQVTYNLVPAGDGEEQGEGGGRPWFKM